MPPTTTAFGRTYRWTKTHPLFVPSNASVTLQLDQFSADSIMNIVGCSYRQGQVVTAPRSPWQNAYVERIIGSIRRECLDHVIVFDERHLRRVLSEYVRYHHRSRTHLSLAKDCPEPRPIQPPSAGDVVTFPQVGGLHHRYERRAA